jgi:hypothetical protein
MFLKQREKSAEIHQVLVSAYIRNDVTTVTVGKNTMDCQGTDTK